ncbi:DinB family protein [Paenibacillus tengchongensis]|uniref:DinB family protein n=1 Tax=Paenibacillus tengchongensis TaxID=2608684 RepID=UPI0016525CC7|nr:DinB family protein [Paenibacillus tengchongensis]
MSDKMVAVLRRQLEPTLEMLRQLIDVCPEDLWMDARQKYWKQIFHATTSLKFWFRQKKEEVFIIPDLGKDVTEAMDEECTGYPTQAEMTAYVEEILGVAYQFMDDLTDDSLLEPCVLFAEITKADVVLMQIRHVQHHVGCCNHILTAKRLEAVRWL